MNNKIQMVDITEKAESIRSATARTSLIMEPTTLEMIHAGRIPKGDVLATARIAAIMAAKKTAEWLPLCHQIPITGIDIRFQDVEVYQLNVEATVRTLAATGVEMEALTAVSAAALSIYDMCKSIDRGMEIGPTILLAKTGGKSGDYFRIDSK